LEQYGKNTAMLTLSKSYSEMEQYAETWIRGLMEKDRNSDYYNEDRDDFVG